MPKQLMVMCTKTISIATKDTVYILKQNEKDENTYNSFIPLNEEEGMYLSFDKNEVSNHFRIICEVYGNTEPFTQELFTNEDIEEGRYYGVGIGNYSGVPIISDNCSHCGEYYGYVIGTKEYVIYCPKCVNLE